MPKIDDGDPAFPMPDVFRPDGLHISARETGMSLRDFFAAAALTGIMANPVRWRDIARRYDQGKMSYDDASKSNAVKAYNIADAMIAARKTGGAQ